MKQNAENHEAVKVLTCDHDLPPYLSSLEKKSTPDRRL